MNDSTLMLSKSIRIETLKMVYQAKASHIGGAFSMADILAVLYEEILNISPENVNDPMRDRLFLSKGHACTSLYATLALKGFFPISELLNYAQNNSLLLAHASHKVPGVELSTGSLGHALSVSCGVALAAKRKGLIFNLFTIVSDGELNEGSNWEAIMFAPHHHLDNLTLIVDYNKIQSFGTTNEVLELEPLAKKFDSFNWHVQEINGHSHFEIYHALQKINSSKKPKVIIAHTIKGKGVDFMENLLLWHYKSPSEQQFISALNQLNN